MKKPIDQATVQAKEGEPWVELAGGRELEGWGKEQEISYNQALRQSGKLRFFAEIFDFLSDNSVHGDYHEFGCHRARTFRMALTEARRHSLDKMKFFAFDSFAGLPEVETETAVEFWKKGALTTTEEQFMGMIRDHGVYVDKVTTVKGYYSDSLTTALRDKFVSKENKISLATIDCDLYESAVPVFNFIEPLLQEGSVLYIDDFFAGYKGSPKKGVQRAFTEYQARSKYKFIEHMQIGWWGRSFITYLP